MNATVILFIELLLVAGVVGGGWRRVRRTRKALRKARLDSLRIIRALQQLMALVQQHRGLVSRLLNGEDAIRAAVTEKQHAVARALQDLQGHYDPALMTPGRWTRIGEQWRALGERLPGLDPQDSFDLHSQLIRQILFLMGDVAEHGQLRALPDDGSHHDALWSDLPATAEAVGQARAVGAGVAAACHCDSVARIKLRFLRQQVAEALRRLETVATGKDAADGFAAKMHRLLTELEQHLLLPATPTITADRYFRIASEALDAIYAECDSTGKRLEQQLAATG